MNLMKNKSEADKEIYFKQYKLFVETAEKVSDRRSSSNKYFLSINSVLLGFSGYLTSLPIQFWHLIISLLGLMLCVYWILILKSYRGLNFAKFSVIHKIEDSLPIKLFKNEWFYMDEGKNPKKYFKLSVLEQGVPILFFALYTILFILNLFVLSY